METEHIRMYLAFNYSDSQLAALLAHAEAGKLAWRSCCCLIGIPTADHPLRDLMPPATVGDIPHYKEAKQLPFAEAADRAYEFLGNNDDQRRERLIPLIVAEMERREKAREQAAEPAQVG